MNIPSIFSSEVHAFCSEYDFDDFAYCKKFENHQNLDETIAKSKSLPVQWTQNQKSS
jgi:hypothetical protein